MASTLISLISWRKKRFVKGREGLVSKNDHKTLGSRVQLMEPGKWVVYLPQNYMVILGGIDDFIRIFFKLQNTQQ